MPGFNDLADHERNALEQLNFLALENEFSLPKLNIAIYNDEDEIKQDYEYYGQFYTVNINSNDNLSKVTVDIEYAHYYLTHNKATSCSQLQTRVNELLVRHMQLRSYDFMPYIITEMFAYVVDNEKIHIDNIIYNGNMSAVSNMTVLKSLDDCMSGLQKYEDIEFAHKRKVTAMSSRLYLFHNDYNAILRPASIYLHIGRSNGIACVRTTVRDFHMYMNDFSFPLNATAYVAAEGAICLVHTRAVCKGPISNINTQHLKVSTPFCVTAAAQINVQTEHYGYIAYVPTAIATLLLFSAHIVFNNSWLTQRIRSVVHSISNCVRHSQTESVQQKTTTRALHKGASVALQSQKIR